MGGVAPKIVTGWAQAVSGKKIGDGGGMEFVGGDRPQMFPEKTPTANPVQSTQEARQRAARSRARLTGRPLLGPGGSRRDEGLQTTLGIG